MEINRTFLIRTLGCKVNQVEGEGLREKFLRRGYCESTQDTGLDVVVINTCTVTANADKRSRALVRRFHRLNPQAKILVTGCYAEKDHNQLTQLDGVHLVVTQNEKETLVDRFLESSPSFATLENPQEHFQELPISQFQGHTRGFLKVQDGCDRNCSYCKVKVVRGASRSRSFGEVKEEAKRLVASGHREIVLTGIQLGAYGDDFRPKISLSRLIEELLTLPDLLRIRLSSIEPGDVTDELIDLMAREDRLAKQMHIPLQSGDDEVLKRMKRGYKREQYLQLIRKIESKVSDFCLSMDCMVGFPGESEAAFERTLEIVERTHALKVHIFPYSPREGTFAYQFTDKVSPQIQKRRMMTFARAAERIAQKKKSFFLGKTVKVLVEESLGRASDDYRGHTTHYLPVQFKSPRDQVNQEVRVRLSKLQGDYLVGDLLSDGCEGF